MKRSYGVGAAGVLAAGLIAGTASAQEFSWQVQGLYPPGSEVHKQFVRFTERVEAATGGRLKIEPLPVATIVPQAEALDAIQAGLLDGAAGTMAYQGGKEPAASFWDFTTGYDDPLEWYMWYEYGDGYELTGEVADRWDAHFVGPVVLGLESIVTSEPIREPADFEGVKMRSPDGIPADIFTKMGAAVSVMPGTEVYTALDTGKIEATDWGTLSVNDEAGYNQIAPYAIWPGIHSMNGMDFVVSQAKWDELPDDIKTIVEMATKEWSLQTWMAMAKADLEAASKRDPETLVNWSDAERKELRSIAKSVWEEWAAKSDLAQRMYQSQYDFIESIGNIQR
jgi:TRAP-type mannitol/chloroaromatic compound transport system substrate-binding protein